MKRSLPLYYFAYGSNMHSGRFRTRVPSGRFIAAGYIEGYELRFHTLCDDGSGKCDAFKTSRLKDRVYGVIYEMDPSDKSFLDDYESVGKEYKIADIQAVSLQRGKDPVAAFMYVALPQTYNTSIEPYDWYKDIVVAGAHEHHLPETYIQSIEQVPAKVDPDTERSRKVRQGLLAE